MFNCAVRALFNSCPQQDICKEHFLNANESMLGGITQQIDRKFKCVYFEYTHDILCFQLPGLYDLILCENEGSIVDVCDQYIFYDNEW